MKHNSSVIDQLKDNNGVETFICSSLDLTATYKTICPDVRMYGASRYMSEEEKVL